jgi:hypothetical protein
MAIVNRSLDASEQRKVIQVVAGAVATGVSGIIGVVPWPCTLDAGEIAAFGLSGAPNYGLILNRFVVGAGVTAITIAVGTSNIPLAYGTSGGWSMVLPASGSTLLSLQANDVLMFQSGVANTAVTGLAVSVVLKPIQDIKINHGQI